jgi:protein-S-isoprenylcysteine O-methyltransferase Ste14
VWIVWALRTKKTQSRESVGSRLSYVAFAVMAFLLMFDQRVSSGWLLIPLAPNWPWREGLGVAVTAAGLAFAVWARAYLGANWSSSVTVKVEHELIQTGPYRWVRHPIYTGMIFGMLGTAIARGQVRGVLAVVLVYVSFYIKSGIEERTMRQTFGEQYEEYSKRTGRIVPWIGF